MWRNNLIAGNFLEAIARMTNDNGGIICEIWDTNVISWKKLDTNVTSEEKKRGEVANIL